MYVCKKMSTISRYNKNIQIRNIKALITNKVIIYSLSSIITNLFSFQIIQKKLLPIVLFLGDLVSINSFVFFFFIFQRNQNNLKN